MISPRNTTSKITPAFSARIAQETALIYDLRVALNDTPRYFIIRVHPLMRDAFLRAIEKDGGYRLEDYGQILFRGWDEPPEDLKAQLSREYGMYAEVS